MCGYTSESVSPSITGKASNTMDDRLSISSNTGFDWDMSENSKYMHQLGLVEAI